MEALPRLDAELAKPEFMSPEGIKSSDVLVLTAMAVASTAILVPLALGKSYGASVADKIKNSATTERIKKISLPLGRVKEPTLRRSQVLRNKNRFVANPDAVSERHVIDFISVADGGVPLGHRPQEELLS
jgi:hypothetical protein